MAWYSDPSNPVDIPVLPLTVEKIANVSSLFRKCGYSSVALYLSQAKAMHIESFDDHKVPWHDGLAKEFNEAIRSCTRGLGAARQSQPLPLGDVVVMPVDDPKKTPGFAGCPIGWRNMFVFGSMYMMREIECSLLLRKNVVICKLQKTVAVTLPASKNETVGESVTRTLGCTCIQGLQLRIRLNIWACVLCILAGIDL